MSLQKIKFELTPGECQDFNRWSKLQDSKAAQLQRLPFPNYGAAGGAYTFSFTPTSIGTVVKIQNGITKETLEWVDEF